MAVKGAKETRADVSPPTGVVGTLPPAIGHAIRDARRKRGVSQARLARLCGLSLRHIVAIEGGANFTVEVLILLALELPQFRPTDAIEKALAQMADDDHGPGGGTGEGT